MRITAIIEKGLDGKYSVRSEEHFGDSFFGGFGDTAAQAKLDFIQSVTEAREEAEAQMIFVPDFTIVFKYDLPSFFDDFDFINASKFAQYVGVNESKMRQYKSGLSYPGEKTARKILDAVHRIGTEFSSVSL